MGWQINLLKEKVKFSEHFLNEKVRNQLFHGIQRNSEDAVILNIFRSSQIQVEGSQWFFNGLERNTMIFFTLLLLKKVNL